MKQNISSVSSPTPAPGFSDSSLPSLGISPPRPIPVPQGRVLPWEKGPSLPPFLPAALAQRTTEDALVWLSSSRSSHYYT